MLKKAFAGLSVFVLLFASAAAHADHPRHDRRYGSVVHRLPRDYRVVSWGKDRYLYGGGCFYHHSPRGYVIVAPPRGVVVPVLPAGYRTIVVEKRPYYLYEDTYYTTAPGGGYVVTEAPAAPATATAEPVEAKPTPIDSYEIHIPNDNGSYTLVVLKKTEKGFIGPQGEFYPEHPTVEQLKDMYGLKKK